MTLKFFSISKIILEVDIFTGKIYFFPHLVSSLRLHLQKWDYQIYASEHFLQLLIHYAKLICKGKMILSLTYWRIPDPPQFHNKGTTLHLFLWNVISKRLIFYSGFISISLINSDIIITCYIIIIFLFFFVWSVTVFKWVFSIMEMPFQQKT